VGLTRFVISDQGHLAWQVIGMYLPSCQLFLQIGRDERIIAQIGMHLIFAI
jgi:hypothetical protein